MLDEVAPEVLWISGLGAVIVFGFMMVVWFVSTREDRPVKKPESSPGALVNSKPVRRKKQYGSPRRKKEPFTSEELSQETDSKDSTLLSNPTGQEENTEGNEIVKVELPQTSEVKPQEIKAKSTKSSKGSDKGLTKEPDTSKPVPAAPHVIPKKQKAKPKQPSAEGNIVTGFEIAEAISSSTLSDEEIQLIMDKLLQKQDEEWEATNKSDNVKTLKKSNEELLGRCQDAEKSVQTLSNRVNELSTELKAERTRSTAAENSYQAKLSKLQEEAENLKKKVVQYKDENRILTERDATGDMKKLESENQSFQHQLSQLALEKSQCDTQLANRKKEIKQLTDDKAKLTKEIQSLTDSKKKLASLEAEKSQIQDKLLNSHEEIQHLQDKISQLQKSEGKLEKEVEDLKKQVNATEVVKETALKSSTERDEEKKDLQGRLETVEKELKKEKDDHNVELEKVKNETKLNLEKLNAKIAQLEAERGDHIKEIDALQVENSSLQESVKEKTSLLLAAAEANEKKSQGTNGIKDIDDTVVQERDELKKENTDMQAKIDNLKAKNAGLRDNCWKARDDLENATKEHLSAVEKIEKEHKKQLRDLESNVISEQCTQHKDILRTLFPSLQHDNSEFEEWARKSKDIIETELLSNNEKLDEKDKRIEELQSELEERSAMTDTLRNTLTETMEKLQDLMKKWEEKERDYNETIDKEQKSRLSAEEELKTVKEKAINLEKEIDMTNDIKTQLQDALTDNKTLSQQLNELKESITNLKESKQQLQQQLDQELNSKVDAVKEKDEQIKVLESEVSQMTEQKKKDVEKLEELENKLKDLETKQAENQKLIDSLRAANIDLNFRLTQASKFSPPPSVSATSSEV